MASAKHNNSYDDALYERELAILKERQASALAWSLKGIPVLAVAAMLAPRWISVTLLVGGAVGFVIQFGGAELKKTLLFMRYQSGKVKNDANRGESAKPD